MHAHARALGVTATNIYCKYDVYKMIQVTVCVYVICVGMFIYGLVASYNLNLLSVLEIYGEDNLQCGRLVNMGLLILLKGHSIPLGYISIKWKFKI
jgi:hypothetical protein